MRLLESWQVRLALTLTAAFFLVANAVGHRWLLVACLAVVVISGVANLWSLRTERR